MTEEVMFKKTARANALRYTVGHTTLKLLVDVFQEVYFPVLVKVDIPVQKY